jgi:solute carrier family 41
MEKKLLDINFISSTDTPGREKWYTIGFQVLIPYIIAGFGTVGAGLVLDTVQHWVLFQNIKEIYVLVPALLGLKGNLEMTLASRFSTQVSVKMRS